MGVTINNYVGNGCNYGYNLIHSSEITEVGYTEPVELEDAKEYLRLLGIDSQDDIVESMIIAARQAFEKAAGISLIEKSVTIYFSNNEGRIPIPFGPIVLDSFELFDEDDDALDFTVIGNEYPLLKTPIRGDMKATYEAGMTTVPEDIKTAIKAQLAYIYENRGTDAETGLCNQMIMAAQRWNKYGFVA